MDLNGLGTVVTSALAGLAVLITAWNGRAKNKATLDREDELQLKQYRAWRPQVVRAWVDIRATMAALPGAPDPGELPPFPPPEETKP